MCKILQQIIILIENDLRILSICFLHTFLCETQYISTLRPTQKFKLRLINQQTGDCTDSMILDAQKLTADSFPVAIKLKGGQRLLMKIKLLSLPAKSNEMLVGQGVVNFNKTSIDSTLRVPIYDKQRGVEQIAICSIDFFLSGFQVDKHVSINVDKSRSRFEDWRQRTEDAVYSQMSYTVESQEGENQVEVESKLTGSIKKVEEIKNKSNRQSKDKHKNKKKEQQIKGSKELIPHFGQKKNFQNESFQKQEDDKQKNDQDINKPFILQNNAYLGQNDNKKKINSNKKIKNYKKQAQTNQNKYNKFAFDQISDQPLPDERYDSIISPQNIKQKVKQNELMISKLKKYIQNIQDNQIDSSPKHNKKRRKNIKVEQYAAYNFQNNFVKYHKEIKSKPSKILKNIKAIRIIKNQIKQDEQGKIIPQLINKFFLTSINNQKIITFDALGFRSHCIINSQSQSSVSIQIPCDENVLKVIVVLNEEGNFQGIFGIQEGEKMNIKLNRINSNAHQSILERSEFKLVFDLKSDSFQRRSAKKIITNSDGSFREPYDIFVPQEDIKKRVQSLSGQPWGFQSYSNQINLSPQYKKIINKINNQLPQSQHNKLWDLKSNQFTQTNQINQAIKFPEKVIERRKAKQEYIGQEQKVSSFSNKTKDYLQNTPIKIKKLKPINTVPTQNHEVYQINKIRNGNRNDYKFKDRTTSKQIKQAWQQILFKRKIQQQQLQRKKDQISRINMNNFTSKKKKKLFDALNTQSMSNSQSQSLSSNQIYAPKTNKLYQYSQNDDKISKYPMRRLKLKIANISITQPQAAIDEKQQDEIGKFVKFAIKDNVIYFTQVIFNGGYNSILWKLDGCIFQQLTGSQKLQIQIYETINNRIKMIGKSQIRINRLFFLRNNHIYNGRIAYNNISNGQFTIGFDVIEKSPFQVIEEEDQDTLNLKKNHSQNKNGIRYNKQNVNRGHSSQKYINKTLKRKGLQNTLKKNKNEMRQEHQKMLQQKQEQLQQSMSMPIGLNRQQ